MIGIGILAIAFIIGIWGFSRSPQSRANSHISNQNHSEMTGNSPMADNSKMDSMHKEMPPNNKKEVPVALIDAGEFGENIYDAAKGDDWKTAEAKLNDLKTSVEKLDQEKIGSEKLDVTLGNLEKLISAKNKKGTLLQSNKFTFDAADLTAKYDTKIPIEVTKLDFYGRELEIWAGEKDEAQTKTNYAGDQKNMGCGKTVDRSK